MKVKYISVIYGFDDIENKINSFIKDKKVIDIKFMDSIRLLEGNLEGTESALIMYEED